MVRIATKMVKIVTRMVKTVTRIVRGHSNYILETFNNITKQYLGHIQETFKVYIKVPIMKYLIE